MPSNLMSHKFKGGNLFFFFFLEVQNPLWSKGHGTLNSPPSKPGVGPAAAVLVFITSRQNIFEKKCKNNNNNKAHDFLFNPK